MGKLFVIQVSLFLSWLSIKNSMIMENNILFAITVEDMQEYAMSKIDRELTEDELDIAKEGLENCLLFDIDTVYRTIITEMI